MLGTEVVVVMVETNVVIRTGTEAVEKMVVGTEVTERQKKQ